jgi:hypothetical protein
VTEHWREKVINRGATGQENGDFARLALGFR